MSITMNRGTTGWWFSCFASLLVLFSSSPLLAQEVFLCVWRNPERTMNRLFPQARDYRTLNTRITAEERAAVEETLGFELLPGQRDRFEYFELTGPDGVQLGYVIAASQRGEFGAIEFVLGLSREHAVNGMYIQRTRERDRAFAESTFLESLTGSTPDDVPVLAERMQGETNHGRRVVLQGVMKELATFRHLVLWE